MTRGKLYPAIISPLEKLNELCGTLRNFLFLRNVLEIRAQNIRVSISNSSLFSKQLLIFRKGGREVLNEFWNSIALLFSRRLPSFNVSWVVVLMMFLQVPIISLYSLGDSKDSKIKFWGSWRFSIYIIWELQYLLRYTDFLTMSKFFHI